jgi:hypothetical protein
MHAGIDTHPIMAGSTTSGPASQIILGSLHRPVRTTDILNGEFDFSPQQCQDRSIAKARIDFLHRGQFVSNPAEGLHGTVPKKFEPAFMEAFHGFRCVASRVHAGIYQRRSFVEDVGHQRHRILPHRTSREPARDVVFAS